MNKENINLPKTSFSMKANLPNKEPEILKIWEKLNLYKRKLRVYFLKFLRNDRKFKNPAQLVKQMNCFREPGLLMVWSKKEKN